MFHLCHFTYRFHWASVSRELSDGARQRPRQVEEGGVREGAEAMPNNVHIQIYHLYETKRRPLTVRRHPQTMVEFADVGAPPPFDVAGFMGAFIMALCIALMYVEYFCSIA